MKKTFFATTLLACFSLSAHAVDRDYLSNPSLGLGLGWQYGLLGVNFAYPVAPKNEILVAAGGVSNGEYAYEIGYRHRFLLGRRHELRLLGLYGTNAAFTTEVGNDEDTETFDGFTTGLSYFFGSRSNPNSGWEFGISLAYNQQAADRFDELEDQGFESDGGRQNPLEAFVSIGYNFGF